MKIADTGFTRELSKLLTENGVTLVSTKEGIIIEKTDQKVTVVLAEGLTITDPYTKLFILLEPKEEN